MQSRMDGVFLGGEVVLGPASVIEAIGLGASGCRKYRPAVSAMIVRAAAIHRALFRDRIPVIRDEVTTLCGPGELIDVVVTERGIAVNPLRKDLIEKVKDSGLPLRSLEELKEEAEKICGIPDKPEFTENIVAVVKWVDGTLLDAIWQVK